MAPYAGLVSGLGRFPHAAKPLIGRRNEKRDQFIKQLLSPNAADPVKSLRTEVAIFRITHNRKVYPSVVILPEILFRTGEFERT